MLYILFVKINDVRRTIIILYIHVYIYQISKFQDSGPLRFLITYCHFRELFLFDPRKMDGILIPAKW